ncbi:hypothetical protein CBM2637_B110360 [Cupriavidus taiwanensis]|nr:hypothetical protein CBM2637_B110360 [Cupriavidus taiwanensis]
MGCKPHGGFFCLPSRAGGYSEYRFIIKSLGRHGWWLSQS